MSAPSSVGNQAATVEFPPPPKPRPQISDYLESILVIFADHIPREQ